MKIFKRGSIWWGSWTLDGERHRVSSGTGDERFAKEFLSKKYSESFREDRLAEKKRRTWVEASERYLDEHQHRKTVAAYQTQSAWWTEQFKQRKVEYLDDIEPDVVKKIRDAEYARPKQRGGSKRSPADVNRKIAYLRAVMNAAYREYRWFGNGEEPPLFRFIPGEIERERYLTAAEATRLSKALPTPYGEMAMMAVATGLRRSNILRMRWEYVDLGSRSIKLPGEIMKNGQALRIPLSGMAVDVLRGQFGKSKEWVFPKECGNPATEIPSKVMAAASEKAGLEDVRWHDLRHTWASLMRQQGLPLEVIQELGGWRDARMVKRYSHLSIDHLLEAAKQLDKAFGGGVSTIGTNLTQPQSSSNEGQRATA
jgi:integrase